MPRPRDEENHNLSNFNSVATDFDARDIIKFGKFSKIRIFGYTCDEL